jgi:hypothetical protein
VKKQIGAAVVACGLLAVSASATSVRGGAPDEKGNINELAPTGKGWGENHAKGQAKPGGGGGGNNGIFYHGGPVMTNQTRIYYIWYGNWNGNTAPTILNDLATGLTGSPYYNITPTYYAGANNHVKNILYNRADVYDAYTRGTSLSDSAIFSIVSDGITQKGLPLDADAVYFVLTSADVTASSGFCTQYCGWHTHGSIQGTDIKYSFVGNPDRCPSSCAAQTVGPNGNAGADGMASIIAHELEEATSDPDLNAWYDRRGYENADKCAWTFGTTSGPTNAKYNMTMGGRNWLIQQNWVNAGGGYCAVAYP